MPVLPRPDWWTSDEWETPQAIVDGLEAEFGVFDLDPCAREDTAKAPLYYTKADDGLLQPWQGRVWLNPPYSNPKPWCQRAIGETQLRRADLVVALLPSATDTGWFHDLVVPYAEVRYLRGRIRFLGWMGVPVGMPKAGNILAIYRAIKE